MLCMHYALEHCTAVIFMVVPWTQRAGVIHASLLCKHDLELNDVDRYIFI